MSADRTPAPSDPETSSGAGHPEVASPLGRRLPRSIEVVLALLVLLYALRFTELHFERNLLFKLASLNRLCEGRAILPFQYRALVPWLIARIETVAGPLFGDDPRRKIAAAIEVACVFLLFYAVRALVGRVARSPWRTLAGASVLFYVLPFQYVLPENFPYWYPSDIPSVLFFALGLLCIQSAQWRYFYPLFALATFNRETTIFLTLVFTLTQLGRLRFGSLAAHVGVQVALWIGVKWLLWRAYGTNPGHGQFDPVVWNDNLAMLCKPRNFLLLASNLGFLWIPLAVYGRRIADPFARRALLVLIPYYAVSVRFAVFDELRIFGEMIPIVVLGIVALADGPARSASGLGAVERPGASKRSHEGVPASAAGLHRTT